MSKWHKNAIFSKLRGRYRISPSGCWVWHWSLNTNGYGFIWHEGRNHYAHRVMWEDTYGPIPAGLFLCHHCDNPACVNLNHLFLGTHADNMGDAGRKGRMRGIPKLNELQVRVIRRLRGRCEQRFIAEVFGIAPQTVLDIVSRKTWKRL